MAKFGTFGKNMLRLLLKEGEAGKNLLEKLNLFQAEPGLLEKYIIASEVSVEMLDTFLARLFGNEKSVKVDGGLRDGLFECLGLLRGENGKSDGVSEELVGLRERVSEQDAMLKEMQRQLHAMRRQLDMQKDVVRVADAVDSRLDEIAVECAERVNSAEKALRDEIRNMDISASVSEIVESIRTKRLKSDEEKRKGALKRIPVQVRYDDARPLDGIIAYLTRECGGNVHEKEIVEVTASSVDSLDRKPENVVDLTTSSDFCSKGEENSWVCYNFKQRRVAVTSYSIRSFDAGRGSGHPRSWVLQVSNDGEVWNTIDSSENNSDLNGNLVTCHFPVTTQPGGDFRFVRLLQTGPNHYPGHRLVISGLELFGSIRRES